MKDTTTFYKELPAFTNFADIADPRHYRTAPEDWAIIITDVTGSTKAIEAGRYKDVNLAGIIGVIGLINMYGGPDFPFVFGGDGATFLLPEALLPQARDVLAETRLAALAQFELPLRVGIVPVKDVYAAGHEVRVARFKVSPKYYQAVLNGSGVDYAEMLIKDPRYSVRYLLADDYRSENTVSFLGISCPFHDVRGSKEETISLIIKLVPTEPLRQQALLAKIFGQLGETLGRETDYHPLAREAEVHWADRHQAAQMARLNVGANHGLKYRLSDLAHRAWNFASRLMPLSFYARDTDFRKFDGSLKMVVTVSKENRLRLEAHLEALRRDGHIFYGLHVSDKAMVTCFAHTRSMKGVHFIDGADGGYALAARQLKQQIAVQKIVVPASVRDE